MTIILKSFIENDKTIKLFFFLLEMICMIHELCNFQYVTFDIYYRLLKKNFMSMIDG